MLFEVLAQSVSLLLSARAHYLQQRFCGHVFECDLLIEPAFQLRVPENEIVDLLPVPLKYDERSSILWVGCLGGEDADGLGAVDIVCGETAYFFYDESTASSIEQ